LQGFRQQQPTRELGVGSEAIQAVGSLPRRAPRDLVPLGWILWAHGVTLAYHFLHMRVKTLGTSSYLSEQPAEGLLSITRAPVRQRGG
jgi:hypothetical protein